MSRPSSASSASRFPRVKLENFSYVYSLALDDKAKHVVSKAGNIRGGRAGKGYSFGVRRR